ncbi:MAG TPA: TonB-dependent receptor [Bacteroidales bacterium]|nr:TonB-dependent receptor [Bacteroidales bacterium]
MKRMILFFSALLFIVYTKAQVSSSIHGKVTDENGEPLSGVSVTVFDTYIGVSTGYDGTFRINGLQDGSYTLRFSHIGYEFQTKEVLLRNEIKVDITLSQLQYMTGEVLVNATRASDNAPLAYSSIDKDIIKKTNISQDIPYLLSLTPSVVETSEAGNGVGYTGMRIRGTDANRINVTVDGIPINDPESQSVFWVDVPDIASSVDNIQIQRGVGTSSNGAGAFGATVSLQTSNPGNVPSVEAGSSYGSFNTFKNTVSVSTGMLHDRFAFQVRYSDINSDGFIDRTWSDHKSAFLGGLYRTGKSLLRANIILGEEHTGLGWWGVPKDSLKANRTYNPAGQYTDDNGNIRFYDNESDNYNQNHYQLLYSLAATKSLNLNIALHYTPGKGYYEEYKEDENLADYGLNPVFIGGDTITFSDIIRRKWMRNDFAGVIYSAEFRKNRFTFTAGGGLNTFIGDHYGTIIWMRTAGNTEKDHQWYKNDAVKSEFSIYGKINYGLSENTRVFGDLQYRYIYYRMRGPDDDLKDISQKHRFGFFNPKAGIYHNINQNQDLWVSFAVANKEPTRADYKEASGDPSATPLPETLYDVETGYKLRTGKSSFSVNLYGMFYKDQLVPTGQLSNVGYSIMTNVARSYRAGIELSAAVKFSDHLSWNSNLTLSRNKIKDFVEYYTDYNTSDWSSQYIAKNLGLVDIAYSPSQVFSSDLAFSSGIFRIHLISKFVGKQYFDNTMSEDRSIDPYFVNNVRFDISQGFRNSGAIEIQFLINNILNEVYENNAYGGNWYEDGTEKTWSYYFPQAGTNYMLRLGLKF